MSANAVMFSDKFAVSMFKKKWFKSFDDVFTKESSRYHKLELLISKIVKALCKKSVVNFESLMKCWVYLDSVGALAIQNIVNSGAGYSQIHSALCSARKAYHTSKLAESCRAKKATIRAAIDKRMESFKVHKGYTIRSVLECSFRKVVLDHLVVDNELVLEFNLVKSKVNYVFDEAFLGVMCSIKFNKLFGVVSFLSNGKAVGLSCILNKFWKHCDKAVLDMLLVFLNFCLSNESGVLTNTQSIALIETAHKILSKILSDRILLAYSTFDILCGDNFSSPIFAIDLVIKDALEKNQELWLVLQDMKKAYDSVGWKHLKKSLVRIKMCSKSYDLQVLCWCPVHLLSSPVRIHISASNNFLAGIVHVLLDCNLSLDGSLVTLFQFHSEILMSAVLVYMDGFLSDLGTASCRAGAAAYFEDIGLGLGICVSDLMLFTLAELQAIALALECVFPLSSVLLFLDSQSALDACKLELSLVHPDFHNQCNDCAGKIAGAASLSNWCFSSRLDDHFLIADGGIVSGNSRHFVHDIYHSVCHACWEYSDSHMAASFTSKLLADARTYFMKALHYQLLVQKHLYSRLYFSVLYFYCDKVEVLDHVFSCKVDESA
ncbi:hypothetical protein G9A89_017988 [Geosiphon pyriformis]|nr:hypothetical protein G9A89_017988 [Geosiphon pyriformis]